jgi:hypothetical protein
MTRILILMTLAVSGLASAAEPLDLSLDEFKMWKHWQNAMADDRVKAMKPEKRNPAIAKDARYKLKDMEAAVAKGEAAGDVKGKCEAALKEAVDGTALKGLLRRNEVDATEPHAVWYVEWANEKIENVEEEASLVAVQAKACPILSSVQLWATDKAAPKTRVFQALISTNAAAKFNPEKVKDFADTLYIRKFEKVKSVANGDDLSAEAPK